MGTPEQVEAARKKQPAITNCLCKPDCDICHGVGYYRVDVERESPEFGQLIRCPNRTDKEPEKEPEGYYKVNTGKKKQKPNDTPLF